MGPDDLAPRLENASGALNDGKMFANWKFPMIAFILSVITWFPKVQISLSPLFHIPVTSHDSSEIESLLVHPFFIAKSPHLLIHSKGNYSIFHLDDQSTACSMHKVSILREPVLIRSSLASTIGITGRPLLVKDFSSCQDDVIFKHRRKNHCDSKFLILTSQFALSAVSIKLETIYSLKIEDIIGVSLSGCKGRDLGLALELDHQNAILVVGFQSEAKDDVDHAANETRKCDADQGVCLIRFDYISGKVTLVKRYAEKDEYRDWTGYSSSLHGLVHNWHKFDDVTIESRLVLTNQELLMSNEASKLSLSDQITIRDAYHNSKKSKYAALDMSKFKANAYAVLFSGGFLIVNNHSLDPVTFVKLPTKVMNHSLHVLWDQQIQSMASVDIGSSLKTIGIPRIFAESRILGQTDHVFQKLLSVQDLIGMTIEESLEDLRFLQPPQHFYAEKPSKFDNFGSLTSGIGTGDPKFLFHIGYGTVKSYDLEGKLQWKSESSANWQSKLKLIQANPNIAESFRPALKKMDSVNAFVIQGFEQVSIISELNGAEIGSHTLPSYPLREPTVFDFNSDSTEDIIIIVGQGLLGFSLCPTFSNVQVWIFYISILVTGCLFLLGVTINKIGVD